MRNILIPWMVFSGNYQIELPEDVFWIEIASILPKEEIRNPKKVMRWMEKYDKVLSEKGFKNQHCVGDGKVRLIHPESQKEMEIGYLCGVPLPEKIVETVDRLNSYTPGVCDYCYVDTRIKTQAKRLAVGLPISSPAYI
ncbi:MAG: hypothetical protein NTY20_01680 [Candidatus Aenigmarchaeota archaeon]|nr:hypothetical protein [Candidatus Aenigmarchaeota archaeon]